MTWKTLGCLRLRFRILSKMKKVNLYLTVIAEAALRVITFFLINISDVGS